MKKFKIRMDDEVLDDAMLFKHYWMDAAVEEFCQHCYSERDGWEWMKDSEQKIIVVDEENVSHTYYFDLDFKPTFYVSEIETE